MRCENCNTKCGIHYELDGMKLCEGCYTWIVDCERSDRAYDVETVLREQARGHLFSIDFIRRSDGVHRSMTCRFGVNEGVKGVGLNYAPNEKGLINVYDVRKHGFRMIPIEGIERITVGGNTYEF